jgi:hypothetical protein
MKVLVAGWFSFEEMGATAGDLMARDLACEWIQRAGRDYDVALAPPFCGGVNWQSVNPESYSDIVFVCGPFGNGWPVTEFLERFARHRLIGLNLSMLEPLEVWNPFALLLERDSSVTCRPDISLLSRQPHVPVVGTVLIHPQPEYGTRDLHRTANDAIERLVRTRELAVVRIDTRLDQNATGLRTPSEVESLIARMDVVLTTRLHGLVLAIKNCVPAMAIDPVSGGAKIRLQANSMGWPFVFASEALEQQALDEAFDFCLTEAARVKAQACCRQAMVEIEKVRAEFLSVLSLPEAN